METHDGFVTVHEAARRAVAIGDSISTAHIYRLIHEGRIEGAKKIPDKAGVWVVPWPMTVLPPPRQKEKVYG